MFVQVTEEVLTLCHFTYMEESIPVPLEELGTEMNQDWRGYMHACVNALLREARERLALNIRMLVSKNL